MYRRSDRAARAESFIVGALFMLALIPLAFLALDACSPPPVVEDHPCVIHADDQVAVQDCMERLGD